MILDLVRCPRQVISSGVKVNIMCSFGFML